MNDADKPQPATRGLSAYLETLRNDPPIPSSELVPRIVRNARWQRAIRAPLRAVGSLVGALAEGLEVLLGSSRRHR